SSSPWKVSASVGGLVDGDALLDGGHVGVLQVAVLFEPQGRVVGPAVELHPAPLEDRDVVGELEEDADVLLYEHDDPAFVGQLADDFGELGHDAGRQAEGQL